MSRLMRVLYFGDPRAGLGLLESSGIQLSGVVHGRSGGEGARRFSSALKCLETSHSIPRWRLPNLEDASILSALKATKPDLIISTFYPRRIPEEVLKIAPGINVHPSALPLWRGPDPAYWVIRSQELETAITIHRLSPLLDEGEILSQRVLKVKRRESGGALAVRLERAAATDIVQYAQRSSELFAHSKRKWLESLQGRSQTGETSWAPLMDPNELEVDWSISAEEVDAFIRAAAPDPCAFTGFGNDLMVIHRGRVGMLAQALSESEGSEIPLGQALIDEGRCLIRCGSGFYQLDEVTIGRRRLSGERLAKLLTGAT